MHAAPTVQKEWDGCARPQEGIMKDDKPTVFDDPCLPGRCPVWPSNLRLSGSFDNDDDDATRRIGLNPADSVVGRRRDSEDRSGFPGRKLMG